LSKIAKVELFHVSRGVKPAFWPSWIPGYPQTHNRFTLIRLTTDDGIVGQAAGNAFSMEREGFGDLLGGFILGIEATDIATVRQRIKEAGYLGWRNWWIEPAFWDIKGKIEGKPVYQLLSDSKKVVEKIPCYASTGSLKSFDKRKPYLDQIRKMGFRGVKIRVHSFDENEDFNILRKVREEVGKNFHLMTDANQGWLVTLVDDAPKWDLERATRFGKVADELKLDWIEEPLDMHAFAEFRELRRRVKTPVAGGELFGSRQEMQAAMDAKAFDIFQPDATFAGGLEDARWCYEQCKKRKLMFSPHTWTNGIGMLVNLHAMAASGFKMLLEFPFEPPGWMPENRDALFTEPIRVDQGGCVAVPQKPGLGIEIDEKQLRRCAKRFHLMTPARLAVKTIREKGLKAALELKKKKENR
jgi:L-alanine-DL-glutamate epimerase-like enolase superfamily enzyme